jgi:hypothetical protein
LGEGCLAFCFGFVAHRCSLHAGSMMALLLLTPLRPSLFIVQRLYGASNIPAQSNRVKKYNDFK